MRGPQSPRDSGLRFAAPSTPPSNPHTPASPHPISHGSENQFWKISFGRSVLGTKTAIKYEEMTNQTALLRVTSTQTITWTSQKTTIFILN